MKAILLYYTNTLRPQRVRIFPSVTIEEGSSLLEYYAVSTNKFTNWHIATSQKKHHRANLQSCVYFHTPTRHWCCTGPKFACVAAASL